MTPAQISATRRWCSKAKLSPITPTTWGWILTPDTHLAEFMAKTDEELASFCAEYPEAPDGAATKRSRFRWPWRTR